MTNAYDYELTYFAAAHSWSAVLADTARLSLPSCRLVTIFFSIIEYFFMILNLVYWHFKIFLKLFSNSLSKIINHKKVL